MAITFLFVDGFEWFQWQKLSIAQGPSDGLLNFHVACLTYPQTRLEVKQVLFANNPNDWSFSKNNDIVRNFRVLSNCRFL